jgi:hypothetical protein
VALTNLSDNFQQMLVEPGQEKRTTHVHQFVIASHTLTSRISALSTNDFSQLSEERLAVWSETILAALDEADHNLDNEDSMVSKTAVHDLPAKSFPVNQLSIIYTLSQELRTITKKINADLKNSVSA